MFVLVSVLLHVVVADPLTIETGSGYVVGQYSDIIPSVRTFLGVPFAKPPIGNLRWAPPEPASNWTEPLFASTFGPSCPQDTNVRYSPFSEDCLTINVFSPSTAINLPVLVWIYGGSFVHGGSRLNYYEGSKLASMDTVVVSLNYRLGSLGFLVSADLMKESGKTFVNFGLLDQQLALRWVQQNIGFFGGDPSQVTIFGESAGSMSISLHLFMQGSQGLFRRAAMESGTALQGTKGPAVKNVYSLEAASDQGHKFITESLKCNSIECARGLDAQTVLNAQVTLPKTTQWFPVFDGYYIEDDPILLAQQGKFHQPLDVLIGDVTNEGTLFIDLNMTQTQFNAQLNTTFRSSVIPKVLDQYPSNNFSSPGYRLAKMFNDYFFTCPSRRLLTSLENNKAGPLYQWQFAHMSSWIACPGPYCHYKPLEVAHASEIPFVFGNAVASNAPFTKAEEIMSHGMRSVWVEFAQGRTITGFPQWTSQEGKYIVFNTTSPFEVEIFYDKNNCDFWDSLTIAS